jgi:phage shock protein A
MQNIKAIAEINDALSTISKIDNSLNINAAQNQFESAQSAVEGKYLKVNARVELSENQIEKLQSDLDRLVIDEEISRRLAKLNPSHDAN